MVPAHLRLIGRLMVVHGWGGLGLLFEIWIVDASIFVAVSSDARRGCVWCLVVREDLPVSGVFGVGVVVLSFCVHVCVHVCDKL